jgi:lambda family phage portal protein
VHPPLTQRIIRAVGALAGRSYDAAGASPRWPVAATMPSQPAAALAARSVLARKSAWLVSNAPIAAAIVDVWVTNLVGDGPSARSGHPNRAMRRALESAWSKFYKHADMEGGDLVSVLNRVVRALVVDGEAFVRFLTVGRGELRLQILPAAQIDASINREIPGGGAMVAGIEKGPNGDVLAYWVLPSSPDAPLAMVGPAVRVDASDICHVYEPRFPGQVRGISWLHAVATSILELDATQDAAIMKAKTTALLCGFIRNLDGSGEDLASGELSLEPGILRRLRQGEDITFSPTSDMDGLNGFLVHMARSIASGAGVPYELACGDLSEVNYSSAKLGLEAFKRRCRAIRASVLTGRLLLPAWERCVTLEVLSGRFYAPGFEQDPEPHFDATFLFPEWAALDPYKESQADVALLNAGLRSRQEIIAARGRDFEEVDAEIQADTMRPRLAAPISSQSEVDDAA